MHSLFALMFPRFATSANMEGFLEGTTLASEPLRFTGAEMIPAQVQVSMWVLTDGKETMGLESRCLARLIVNDFLTGHEVDEME